MTALRAQGKLNTAMHQPVAGPQTFAGIRSWPHAAKPYRAGSYRLTPSGLRAPASRVPLARNPSPSRDSAASSTQQNTILKNHLQRLSIASASCCCFFYSKKINTWASAARQAVGKRRKGSLWVSVAHVGNGFIVIHMCLAYP